MDWAGLLPDLLHVILGKLVESTDHLRFRFVCCSWRSTARSHPMPPSLPWLHLPHGPISTNLKFYSFSEHRVYKIPFREGRVSRIVGSASGFLLLIGCDQNPKLSIINPFTGTRADLPYTAPTSQYIVWEYLGSIIVGNFGCVKGAAYCRPGDHSWTSIKALENRKIESIICKAGSFYLLDGDTVEVLVLDGETLDVSRIIQPPEFIGTNLDLVMSSDDDDVQLFTCFMDHTSRLGTVLFNVNPQLEELRWSSRINDMGNHVLFDHHHRFNFLFEASSRYAGLRKKGIFPIFDNKHMMNNTCSIYVCNLENFSTELIAHYSCSSKPFWILPSFN